MGRATRWLKGLFGIKRSDSNSNTNPLPKSSPDKRRWRFVKSFREKPSSSRHLTRQSSRFGAAQSLSSTTQAKVDPASYYADDPTKHAISVAAASAAAAEAAVVSAKAAAAVVRLTTSSGREPWAALMIQSLFRGYLARRALRALKGLVRLQALVRGHIMRKKAAETMKCMQAMLRAQARARAVRVHLPDSPYSSGKSSQTSHRGPPTPEKFEQGFYVKNATRDHSPVFRRSSSRLSSRGQDQGYFSSSSSDPRIDEPTWDLPRRDKILKVDPAGKSNLTPPKRRKSLFESSSQHSGLASDQISHTYTHSYTYTTSKDSTARHGAMITTPSVDVQLPIFNPLKLSSHDKVNDVDDEEGTFCTAQNSPHFHCASPVLGGGSSLSRRGTAEYTPTKSDESFSGLSFYSDCPSYMACTESSRAKIRSLSAPRQRPPSYERSSSTKRWSVHHHGHGDSRSSSQRASTGSSVHSSYSSKAYYPGSGRLDRLGMPVRNSCGVYYSGYLN